MTDASESMVLKDKHIITPSSSKRKKSYDNSIFKIYTSYKHYDYRNPWRAPTQRTTMGAGFVIEFEGQHFLLTNAHMAQQNHPLLQIRLAEDDEKYVATIKYIDNDCDLALLEVKEAAFWQKVTPLTLGQMPKPEQSLRIHGFPVGGNELSITEGIISRIEVDTYSQSDVSLLQVQISAPMNPGNSGGPAIRHGKVIGVAFQSNKSLQSMGYIIPPPILHHFLRDATNPPEYQGFPNLELTYQCLTDAAIRAHFWMEVGQTGIRVKHIDPLSSAYNKLKRNDILLEIDGIPIKNDGTIETEFSKRINFNFLVSNKQLNDTLLIRLLREGKIMDEEIVLQNRPFTTKYAQREYEKPPTYYIASGLVMMPVTQNYIDSVSHFSKYQSKPKKTPGEEIVVINSILASDCTRHLEPFKGGIIKTVNDQLIKNMRDVISAMENNTDKNHVIVTKSDDFMVIKRLEDQEHQKLLKSFQIFEDRSEDLKSIPVYRPGCPEAKVFAPAFELSKALPSDIPEDLPNNEELGWTPRIKHGT